MPVQAIHSGVLKYGQNHDKARNIDRPDAICMTKILLRLLVLALVVSFFYYLYWRGEQPSETRPFAPYRLDELSSKPLPKQVFLDGVRLYADGFCKDEKFLVIVKTDKQTCLAQVDARHSSCLAQVAVVLPDSLNDQASVEQYSKQYVGCVTPQ
jgi:hypothetical protein